MIYESKMFAGCCDNCQDNYETSQGYGALFFPDEVRVEMEEDGWHVVDGKHYCPSCHYIDDNDALFVDKTRFKEPASTPVPIMFTKEEIQSAKATRDEIISQDIKTLKSIYMAGEICMWDELNNNTSIPTSLPTNIPAPAVHVEELKESMILSKLREEFNFVGDEKISGRTALNIIEGAFISLMQSLKK